MNNQNTSRISVSIPARSSLLVIGLAVLLASTFAAASTPQGHFEKTMQVSGPLNLEVQTGSGDVIVHSGASGSVSIRAKIFVGDHWLFGDRRTDVSDIEQHPPIRQDGNSIHIDKVTARNISIDYEITVPVDTAVRSHSGSGNQTIEGTHGNAEVTTGSGDVRLSQLTGEIHLQTGSGNVRALEVAGPLRGGTGSGDVEVEKSHRVTLICIPAPAIFRFAEFRALFAAKRAVATSPPRAGRRARGRFTPVGQRACTAALECRLRRRHLDQFGHAGRGRTDHMTVQGRVHESRKSIVGKARGGGPSLTVRTGSGDIHIE